MSLQVKIYSNQSERNKLTKSLSELATLEGVLREPTNFLCPIIDLKVEYSLAVGANYAHVPALGRYYFITNAVATTSSLVTVEMEVDVLMSFAKEIRQHRAIVNRAQSASVYDLTINDGSIVAHQDPIFEYIKFKDGDKPRGASSTIMILAGATN